MSKKSQQESEQPAKVYQLDAVETKVDTVLVQLQTILQRTDSLVTNTQLEASKKDMEDKLAESVKDIHAEYRPILKKIGWLYTTVIGEAIALLGTAAAVIFLTR